MPAALATAHPHLDSLLPIVAILIALLAVLWAVVGVALAPLLPGGWWAVLGVAGAVTVLPLVGIVRLRLRGGYPGRWVRLLVMRPFWYATLALLLLAPLGLVGMLGGALAGMAVAAAQWTLVVGATLLALLLLAGYLGSRRLVVRRLTVPVAGLPAQFDGLTIAQISDLHVGPHTPRRFIARVAARVREARPDLIAVTGDMVDDFARDVDEYAVAFGDLAAPLGVYAIPGNHDVYAGWPAVRARLERLPLRVLVNDVQLLHRDGATLAIVGIGDPAASHGGTAAGGPEPDAALALVPPGVCAIALAHNPLLWPALARGGVALTLSGHTHNGQFAIPALGWSLASPFLDHVAGLYRERRSRLYINPGTNYWGIPFRLGTPAEVTVLVLERDDSL
ncbi:MAG: metallophosphoesterase [Gemmatimonadaceae bacterium]